MTPIKICEIVSEVVGLDYREIYSKSRKADVILARQIAIYIMCNDFGYSEPMTGRHFWKDHSTIHHHKKVINKYLDEENVKVEFLIRESRRRISDFGDDIINLSLRRSEVCYILDLIKDMEIRDKLRRFLIN